MIKNFDKFVKESVENKGKGPGNQDLFNSAPKKQVINRAIPTMDFLRVGKHILTKEIDGFIDSVQNESIFITDRMTGEIKKYTLKEVLKELTSGKEDKASSTIQGFEGTPAWAKKQKIYEADQKKNLEPKDNVVNPDDDLEYTNDDEDKDEDDDEEIDTDEVNEELDPQRQRQFEPDEVEVETLEEEDTVELSDDEEDELSDDEEEDVDNRKLFGTEDNPEGVNKGNKREMPNENWIKYWENFNNKHTKLILEEIEEEDEVELIRGTEDNPLPTRKKTKFESYE